MVVGSTATRPRFGVRRLLRHRLGSRQRPDRAAGPGYPRRRERSDGRRGPIATGGSGFPYRTRNRQRHRQRGARATALPADRLAHRDLRLPTLLLDHVSGGTAAGRPSRFRREPRGDQTLVRRGAGGRSTRRPSRRVVRPGGLSAMVTRAHRSRCLDRGREDPGPRREPGCVPAGRRHHRIRCAARDRRPVHRAVRRSLAHRGERTTRSSGRAQTQSHRRHRYPGQRTGPAVPGHHNSDRAVRPSSSCRRRGADQQDRGIPNRLSGARCDPADGDA